MSKPIVGTTNRSMAAMSGAWLRKKVRHPWLGGPRRLTMYLATLDCAISNPSLSSSPWMRGAPQSGFSNETEQPDHSANLGDSITSSTQIRFSVHTSMAICQTNTPSALLGLSTAIAVRLLSKDCFLYKPPICSDNLRVLG